MQRRTPLEAHQGLQRRAPMARKSELRTTRSSGFKVSTIKPWRPPKHTAAEDARLGAVAALGCIACEKDGYPGTPACVHHLRTRPDGQRYGTGLRAPHSRTIPLCEGHHQGMLDTTKLAFHKNPKAFEARYGSELQLLEETNARLETKHREERIA